MALALRNFPDPLGSESIHNGRDVVRASETAGNWSPAQANTTPEVRAYRAINDQAPNAEILADEAGLQEGVHYVRTSIKDSMEA